LRRSRLAADIAASRIATESALRRSRVEAEIVVEEARRARIGAEIEAERYATEDALRRSRVAA
jgi:hypothetical protein